MLNLISASLRLMENALKIKILKKLGYPIKPKFINFIATYQCNSRCIMCNIWNKYSDNPNAINDELSIDDIKLFFNENKEYLNELKSIGITGGESLLRDDIVDIVRVIHDNFPKIRKGIQSNGLATKLICNKIQKILELDRNFGLGISLDGIEDTHNKIRGSPYAYKRAIETIVCAKSLGVKSITNGMVLSSINYNEIENVSEISKKFGCEFSCFMIDKSDDYFDNLNETYELNQSQINTIIASLEKFSYHYYMDNLRLILLRKRKRTLTCYSGYTSIVIDPYGNVKPCILRSEVFGNIREKRLIDILNNDSAKKIREKIEKCSCWNQCEVSTSAIIDFYDVFFWFIKSKNKMGFLRNLSKKTEKFR
jgi:MoaA/NifB/PqqE/SkfB family radical SAM enzyme